MNKLNKHIIVALSTLALLTIYAGWIFIPSMIAYADLAAGTVNAKSTQVGTWTVQPGNTANTTAWLVDESATLGLATLTTGQQAVTTSAAALPTNTAKKVCVKVLIASATGVYFGPSGTTILNGQELSPGDAWCGTVNNTNKIFVVAGGTGSTVAFDLLN